MSTNKGSVIATTDTHRVLLVLDEDVPEPTNDAGFPIVRLSLYAGPNYPTVARTGYGNFNIGFDAIEVLTILCARFPMRKAVEVFERYVHVFHDGSVMTSNIGSRTQFGYVAISTRTLARDLGVSDHDPVPRAEMKEWDAYLEGEVYGLVIEERVSVVTSIFRGDGSMEVSESAEEWREVNAVWGFYGVASARAMARSTLADFTN